MIDGEKARAALLAKSERTHQALLTLMEIHTEGITVSELAAYTERDRSGVAKTLKTLEEQGAAHAVPQGQNTNLWYLTPHQEEVRSLTPSRLPQLPLRTPKRRHR